MVEQANMFLYGSCVSRDTYSRMGEGYGLLAYVARQSLISAMSRPTQILAGAKLESPFQNRALEGDLSSSLIPTIEAHVSQADIVVMDLVDERLGVLQLPDESFVTRSHELVRSNWLEVLDQKPPLIRFGTDEHFTLWTDAANKFVSQLRSLGCLGRVVLLQTPWAEKTDSGDLLRPFRGIPASHANEQYARYFRYLEDLNITHYRLPDKYALSTESHRWGPSPFHYFEPAYIHMRDAIRRLVAG